MSELLKKLKEIQDKLKTQDNHGTQYPLYCVFKEEKVVGFDTSYTDDVSWFGPPDEPIEVKDKELIDILDKLEEHNEESWTRESDGEEIHLNDYFKSGWKMQLVHLETFLTEKAAKEFIKNNSHRHREELVMIVESAYRNPELQAVINFLKTSCFSF